MKLDASAGKLPDRRVGLATGVGGVSVPVTRDGFSYIEGTLTSSTDSQAPFATVDQLRSSVHAIAGADGLVGGSSAINLDTQRAARHDHDLVVPLVLVAVFVILALVLRAQPRRRALAVVAQRPVPATGHRPRQARGRPDAGANHLTPTRCWPQASLSPMEPANAECRVFWQESSGAADDRTRPWPMAASRSSTTPPTAAC
jgi:hypothetical protein